MKGFGAGFRNRNPLVLLVAAALLVPALLGFEYLFTSGAWSAVPLEYCLRSSVDSFTYVSWTVGHNKRRPPDTPAVYLTGGSAAREAIVSGPSLAAEVRRSGGPRIAAWDLACINQNFAETLAVADNVPDSPAWVLIGVNLGRFTAFPAENEQQVVGRDLVLKSSFLQQYVSSAYGRYRYSYTILPGIFSYLTSYLKKDGPALLAAGPTAREYRQHHYTLSGIRTPAQKERLVKKWSATRYPVFRRNLAYNLAMLEQLVTRCRAARRARRHRGAAAQRGRRQGPLRRGHRPVPEPVKALAGEHDVPYLDFNRELAIPSADFHDLSHLVEPGRELWQTRLAEELVTLPVRIYFTLYLIPVVLAALLVFWLLLRRERVKLIFLVVLSVAVLALLHPAFAAIAVGLVVVAHQLVDLKRREKLSGGRVVLIIVAITVITLGDRQVRSARGHDDLGRGRLGRLASADAAGHQLLRLPPVAVRLRLHARRHRGELAAAARRLRDVHPHVPGRAARDLPGVLREAQLLVRPAAVLPGAAAHRPGLLQEGLRRRLRVRHLLHEDHHDGRQPRLRGV